MGEVVSKRDLLDQISRTLSGLGGPTPDNIAVSKCKDYSHNHYENYLNGTMAVEERTVFEQHCMGCESCLIALHFANEKLENEALYQRTMKVLDGYQESIPHKIANVFQIIMHAARDTIKVIKTSGEVLHPLSPVAVRGVSKASATETTTIIQDFPHVSIQAEFKQSENLELVELTLSLMDTETADVIEGAKVQLTGDLIQKESTTDLNGQAKFEISKKGIFQIVMKSNDTEYMLELQLE